MTSADLQQAVDRTAEQVGRRRAGVVVGAVLGGAEAVAARGDTGDGTVPDARSLFEIGSVTKVFTALLLADGVVRGRWRLDTPVQELLPPQVRVPTYDGLPITLGHLATHTSGLPRSPAPPAAVLTGTLGMLRGRDPYAALTPADVHAFLARTRLRRAPGTGRHRYSNLGFGLLGSALAHAAGSGYDELVRDRVCTPLGLHDTVTEATASPQQRARTVRGHHGRRRRPAEPWPLTAIPGAGALRSTAADVLRFLRIQLDPAGSPLEEAVRLAQRPHHDGSTGLAWQRSTRPHVLLWHNGGTGGFRSWVGLVPERGLAVAVLSNHARMVDLGALDLVRRLA